MDVRQAVRRSSSAPTSKLWFTPVPEYSPVHGYALVCNVLWLERAYPLVVVDEAGPVEHVHHGLKAKNGRLAQLAVMRYSQRLSCQLDRLVCLCPGKLLLPCLPNKAVVFWTTTNTAYGTSAC